MPHLLVLVLAVLLVLFFPVQLPEESPAAKARPATLKAPHSSKTATRLLGAARGCGEDA